MKSNSRSFSLAGVFLLVTVAAVVTALFVSAREPSEPSGIAAAGGPLAYFIGLVGGIYSGLSQPRRLRSSLLGGFIGFCCGIVGMVMFTAPAAPGIALGACAALLMTGLILRRAPTRAPEDPQA